MTSIINMALLTMLVVVVIAIIRQRSLFGVVILSGIYSFLIAGVLVVLDAVDVAMTEASVGAGISTVILLATLHLVKTTEMRSIRVQWLPMAVVLGTGAMIIWGTLKLPLFGTPNSAIHEHVAPRYLSQAANETGVINVVTAVLADYRSFDTLGEVTVVFTAGIGVILLLRRSGRRRRPSDEAGDGKDGALS